MTGSRHDTVATDATEDHFIAHTRQELDRSCDTLDGQTLSRLNTIRHRALEGRQARQRTLLLPFGGLVSACAVLLSVILLFPEAGTQPEGATVAEPPIEDIDLLTATESLDFYEDYEFYQWLAENGSSI